MKSEASVRTLRLPEAVVSLLHEYKAWQDTEKELYGDAYVDSDYIFTKRLGGPMHPDSVTDYMKKFGKKYGLPHVNPHKFRHTVASILIFKGVDVVTVSKYLGHESPEVTSTVYAHFFQEALAKASVALGEILLE